MNYVFCLQEIYLYMVEYIASISRIIKIKLILYKDHETIMLSDTSINHIFIQDLPKNLKLFNDKTPTEEKQEYNIFIINTEQLSFAKHSHRMNSYSKEIKIIDYNVSNIKYYNDRIVYLLPYQINRKEIFNFQKTYNICMIDSKSKYRLNIVNRLNQRGYHTDIIKGFGLKRDYSLFRYKILINISHNPDYNILETMRCDRCIYNKMIVISDTKEDMDKYYLKDYIIFVPYEKMVEKIIDVLNNYTYYYNSIFKNLNYPTIDKKIQELSSDAINGLHNT